MDSQNACLSIAFLIGDPRRFNERVVMDATGGPFVHAEVLLSSGGNVRAYASLGVSGFTVSNNRPFQQPNQWRLVHFPLTQGAYKPVYALILQILAMNLPYNSLDTWQCCIKLMLPFERDLDCCNLESWRESGVFCSQVCLLFLRRMGRMGAFARPQLVDWHALETTNSRGCSPNTLYSLLTPSRVEKNGGESARARPYALSTPIHR